MPQAWPDRREPPAVRAAARLSSGGKKSPDAPDIGDDGDDDPAAVCDVRLLFVSGTGVVSADASSGRRHGPIGSGNGGLSVPGRNGEDDSGDGMVVQEAGKGDTAAAATTDMWGVLGRELWRPWPQADVVVHTGSQVGSSGAHAKPRFRGVRHLIEYMDNRGVDRVVDIAFVVDVAKRCVMIDPFKVTLLVREEGAGGVA